jgi:hypothetical protein
MLMLMLSDPLAWRIVAAPNSSTAIVGTKPSQLAKVSNQPSHLAPPNRRSVKVDVDVDVVLMLSDPLASHVKVDSTMRYFRLSQYAFAERLFEIFDSVRHLTVIATKTPASCGRIQDWFYLLQ